MDCLNMYISDNRRRPDFGERPGTERGFRDASCRGYRDILRGGGGEIGRNERTGRTHPQNMTSVTKLASDLCGPPRKEPAHERSR